MKKLLCSLLCFSAITIAKAQVADNSATVYISGISFQIGTGSVLPVSLISFNGTLQVNKVLLQWQTATEKDNERFEILRFSQGNPLAVKIAEVRGSGNASNATNYSFTDEQPLQGINFYQLQQVDVDGRATLSKVVSVTTGLANIDFKVFQNGNSNYAVSFASQKNGMANFSLVDASGRVLKQFEAPVLKGHNKIALYGKALPTGTYIACLYLDGSMITQKFIAE